MELGIALPTSGALASPANIAAVAKGAEQLGYAAVWTYERLLRPVADVEQPGGTKGQLPENYALTYEPLETLSYVAALTSTVKLGTSIINALMHPPVVLARRFATLDQLSGGRVIAGVGQGWMQEEFDAVGVSRSRIGTGMDETLDAIRACWGPDPVEVHGSFPIVPSQVNPKPVQANIPILMGSMSPGGIKRAARIADGLNPIAFSADALRGTAAAFREAARANGRDVDALQVIARANVPVTADPLGADRPYLGGSPAQIAEDLAALDDAGVNQVLFYNLAATTDLDAELRLIEQLQAEYAKRS
jgi:probable F420-dependent oxidoreductase